MAAITWEELVQKGGGNIHYIFTVAGYPWAVTDHPDVKTLLNAGDTAGKTARKKIFGSTLLNSPELLTDGDMEASDTSAWTAGQSTLSKETASPKKGTRNLKILATAGSGVRFPTAYQAILTSGKTYRVKGWHRSDGTEAPTIDVGGLAYTGTTSKSWVYFDFEHTSAGANLGLYFTKSNPTGTEYVEFDDVTVKEVTTYLAESTTKFPVFATLENVSNQRWNLDEIQGSISGGSWSVDIADLDLGHAWNTTSNVGNANTWGLPGVHAKAQPYSDSNVGFGNLHEPCVQSSSTLTIYEQDGGTLDTGIPSGSSPDSEYRLLWINQECVAAAYALRNGTELLVDGDMEDSGYSAWTLFNSPTVTKETADPAQGLRNVKIYKSGAVASIYQTTLTIGKTYRVTGYVRSDGTATPTINSEYTVWWTGTTSTSWQYFDFEKVSDGVTVGISKNTTAGNYVEGDGMSVKKLSVSGSEDISNEINLSARGVARSRNADHWTNFYEGVTNPLVIDTPASIIDKPCTLFAIGLTDDGSSILTQPVKVREGVVGTNIKTRDGVTNISILSFLNRLDNDLQLPKYEGSLARYVFYRGNVSLGDANTINGFEMPHLVIREYDPTDPNDTVGTNKYIWLSSTTSSAEYDTVEDIYEALSYKFGSSLASTYLDYNYSIKDGKMYQTDNDGSQTYRLSLITGPLAWILNLGAAPTNMASGNLKWSDRELAEMIGSKSPEMFQPSAEMLTGDQWWIKPWMTCLEGTGGSVSNTVNISNRFLEPQEYWIAKYYYSYMWDEDEKDELSVGNPLPETDNFIIPEESGGTTQYLYLTGEDAATQFQVGEEISIGSPSDDFSPDWPNYARFEIASIAADSGFTKITATSGYVTKADTKTPFVMGRPIFTMPAFDLAFKDSLTENPDEYYDMWKLGERPTTEAKTLGKLLRSILNDPGHGVDIPSILQLTHIAGFTTEDDFVSIIDWDDLDEKSKQAREELRLGKYKLLVTDSINLYEIFKNELVLHGIAPTYEWEQESGQFRIKFRHLAPLNTTQAVFSGRVINNTNLVVGQTTESSHNDTWLANSGTFKTNYLNGEYYREYNLTYQSGFAMNRRASRSMGITSQVSHIGASEPVTGAYLMKMLRYFSRPNPVMESRLAFNAFVDVALGQEVAINDATARNPYSHELGLTDKAAIITSISYDWMRGLMRVTYKLEDENIYGYAPACYVTSGNSEKIGSKQISCNSELHEFSNLSDRVDCMWFDCYYWNQSTNTYTAKGCSCGEYKIIAFERYTNTPTLLYFNVESVSSDGTIVIEDQDGSSTNYNAWVTTKNYVLIFADWDDVESCQQKFLYFADENDTLGTGNDRGFRWG
jgi:hypothetical protein